MRLEDVFQASINNFYSSISSITWRSFETELCPNYFAVHRAKESDKNSMTGFLVHCVTRSICFILRRYLNSLNSSILQFFNLNS